MGLLWAKRSSLFQAIEVNRLQPLKGKRKPINSHTKHGISIIIGVFRVHRNPKPFLFAKQGITSLSRIIPHPSTHYLPHRSSFFILKSSVPSNETLALSIRKFPHPSDEKKNPFFLSVCGPMSEQYHDAKSRYSFLVYSSFELYERSHKIKNRLLHRKMFLSQ